MSFSKRLPRGYGLLLGLMGVAIWVALDPFGIAVAWGLRLRQMGAPDLAVAAIFLFSGLKLSPDRLRSGISDRAVIGISVGAVYGIAPVVAAGLARLPLDPGVRTGILLVAAMPTTLSSGVVMTAAAGGNEAAALAATLASNLLGVMAVPWVLATLLGPFGGLPGQVTVPHAALAGKIALLVVLPLATGLWVRQKLPPALRERPARINPWLVAGMVWIGLAGSRGAVIASPGLLAVSLALSALFHAIVWIGIYGAARLARLGPDRRKALLFTGGQKTLPLALLLQTRLFPGQVEVLVVCVVHHLIHLVMDGYLVGRIRAVDKGGSPRTTP